MDLIKSQKEPFHMLLLRNLALGLYLIERLLAEVYWLRAQSQDPLEQKVRPLVCMPNPKWSCMSLPRSWDLQVPWFGSMGVWHINPLFFSLSSLQIATGHWLSCKWKLSCGFVVFFFFLFNNLIVKLTSECVKIIGIINFEHQSHCNFFLWTLVITPLLFLRQLYENTP